MSFETGSGISSGVLYGAMMTAVLVPLWAWLVWVTVKSWQLYLDDKFKIEQTLLAFFKSFALVAVSTLIILV